MTRIGRHSAGLSWYHHINRGVIMSHALSKARQIAEIAFDQATSQFRTRTRALQEWETEISERAEKTLRLRATRLEREQSEKSVAALATKCQRNTQA